MAMGARQEKSWWVASGSIGSKAEKDVVGRGPKKQRYEEEVWLREREREQKVQIHTLSRGLLLHNLLQ